MKKPIVILVLFAAIALGMIATVHGIFTDNWIQVISSISNVIFALLIINSEINGIRR